MVFSGDLYKITKTGDEYRGGKYIIFRDDGRVFAGSISSREGWITTPVQWGFFDKKSIHIRTLNSNYMIVEH